MLESISTKRGRGRPKADHGPDPKVILAEGLSTFARLGWSGTDLRLVALDAGVDAALIARRYDGKMGFWRAVVDHVSEMIFEASRLDPEQQVLPTRAKLEILIDRFIDMNLAMPDIGRFFIDEIGTVGARCNYVREKIWDVHRRGWLPVLREAEKENLLPEGCDAANFLLIVIGSTSLPLMMRSIALPSTDAAEQSLGFARSLRAALGVREHSAR